MEWIESVPVASARRLLRHTEGNKTVAWALVITAGILEVLFAVSLKQSDGFSKLWWTIAAFASGGCSFLLLTLALKSLPVGTAYAVWTGLGAAGTVLVGILALGEPATTGRITSIVLVLGGIVGLKFYET